MKKRINFIVPGIFNSGGMRIIFEYAERLSSKDFDVMLYYPFLYYNLKTGKKEYTLNPKRLYWAYRNYKNSQQYKKKIKDNYSFGIKGVFGINDNFIRDADYTFATSWPTSYDVNNLGDSKGVKYYFVQDYESWDSNIELVDNSYLLNLKKITISKYLSDLLFKKLNVKSETVLNGIDYNIFRQKDSRQENKEHLTITYIDYKLNKKNTEAAIKASISLKQIYPQIKILSFGLKQFHKHPEFVKFYPDPPQEKIADIYNMTDIFLFTSSEEGFGLPPAEAMACGAAVVTTPVGAIPEYCVDRHSAYFIDANNQDSIINAVSELILDKDKLKSISNNGYKMIREKLDWNKSVEKFIDLLA